MGKTLPGRPRLNLELTQIIEAVRRKGTIMAASRKLLCSDAYIHARFKDAGLTLLEVLTADSVDDLLHRPAGTDVPKK